MTIYATVNNIIGYGEKTEPIWTLISPSAILQGGNPYFVPDFAARFEARTALAVRIGKLGKSIAPRFVHRYVDAAAPAVVFVAADRLEGLRDDGLPWTSAMSYDRSLAIGRFTSLPYEDIIRCRSSLSLKGPDHIENAEEVCLATGPGLEETVAAISRDNTLKTGDILLIGIAGSGPTAAPGMRAHIEFNGEDALEFNIR
ncbi:MAG: fumarylacetoacetate hydrolase family protein [Muribaculaceae bacterium]|nr:fumarylacetoacetate hydrolase family protein [Muribaculaceae bacterium]MDE6554176.1 fumarylacetoacetate hydrolase family protein [Muribaculaceae bacterium]